MPGALDHASAEVDEFDAAIVRGSGGVPVPAEEIEEAERETEPAVAEPAGGGAGAGARRGGETAVGNGGGGEGGRTALAQREPAPAPRASLPARALAFLRASWAELQRVQWPDRPEVFQATAVVLGFVAVMGVYLGVADWVAQKIINFIL